MLKKTHYLLLFILFILLVGSAVYKYYTFVIERDFVITSEISCDPEEENCFIWDCDLEDEECDQTPYKYITKNAKNAEVCDPYVDESCEELSCLENEEGCEITTCSEEDLGDEEVCSDEFYFEQSYTENSAEESQVESLDEDIQDSTTMKEGEIDEEPKEYPI